MSLINRTVYLLSELNRLVEKIQPLVDSATEVINMGLDQVESIENNYNKVITEITDSSSTDEYKQTAIASLVSRKVEAVTSYINLVKESKEGMLDSISESIEATAKDFPGVDLDVDISLDGVNVIPTPKLFDPTTDFVKNTLISPETTVVTPTGPGTIITT